MEISYIIHELESKYPLCKQEQWDHSGLQLGNIYNECKGILVCLNVDENTITQAIEHDCNLIISHHPFLFHPVKEIDTTTIRGKNIAQLIKNDITVYSMHTNYDALRMNSMLLEKLGCIYIESVDESGICQMGSFKLGLYFEELISLLKETFNHQHIRVCGKVPTKVKTISLVAGSGHDYMKEALSQSDVFITGDLTYTHAMDIIELKEGCVIELSHFIEEAFKQDIKDLVGDQALLATESDYYRYY